MLYASCGGKEGDDGDGGVVVVNIKEEETDARVSLAEKVEVVAVAEEVEVVAVETPTLMQTLTIAAKKMSRPSGPCRWHHRSWPAA